MVSSKIQLRRVDLERKHCRLLSLAAWVWWILVEWFVLWMEGCK